MSESELESLLRSTNRVNAWTEWGKLNEICVGRADGACYQPPEPNWHKEFTKEGFADVIPFPVGPRLKSVIKRANSQLDYLVEVLEGEGAVVHRTRRTNFHNSVKTPDFEIGSGCTNTCPRDTVITIGNVVLEATMSRRARYFEFLGTRHIVHHLFKNDKNMLWKSAPKPSMADSMYDLTHWDTVAERKIEREQKSIFRYAVTDKEPVFDAASMVKLGADVIVLNDSLTNMPGIEWMQRELKGHVNFRILRPPKEDNPTHIDGTFMPLRPPTAGSRGIMMYCDTTRRSPWEEDLDVFRTGGFDVIPVPTPTSPPRPMMCQCSPWIGMNVLQVSPKKIIVEAEETWMKNFLEDLGFEVILVPFRNVLEFGGSLHCSTWDINRDDEKKEYLTGENGDVAEHSRQTNGH